MFNKTLVMMCVLMMMMGFCFGGCETAPRTEAEAQQLQDEAQVAINAFIDADPTMRQLFQDSYGYAVYPNVGSGGVIVGGAHGEGVVYERGSRIGYSELSQGDVGLQLGGRTYRQVVFFENERALNRLRREQLEFAAHASAVAVREGVSADASYADGVLVFTETTGGMMFEAAIGGQQFTFEPIAESQRR